jgi:histidinol phosphatase-like enzyme
MSQPTPRRAAFLDRDGVINIDKAYVHRVDDLEFVPGVVEGLRFCKQQVICSSS